MPKPADALAARDLAQPLAGETTAISWAETRAALRADRAHWARRLPGPVHLRRGYQAIWIYRMSRYAHENGWRMAAWLLWIANGWATGVDIPPTTRIAGGMFLPHPYGTIIAGAVGRDATFGFQASIGGLYKTPDRDVGGGPGLPRLGDGVVLEPASIVLGPVLVGDRVRVGPRCLVLKDLPDDTELAPIEWRGLPGRSTVS